MYFPEQWLVIKPRLGSNLGSLLLLLWKQTECIFPPFFPFCFTATYDFIYTGMISLFPNCPICHDAKLVCLRNQFSDIVLVIVYNYPFYSSIPSLTALYKNAFPTIMFCGPHKATNYSVEAVHIHKGYFSYTCMSRAMEKHPGYTGYLLINDDVMLNYWNLVGMDREKIWEGPKGTIRFLNYSIPGNWYWWNSTWGMKTCQKAFNEIWALQESTADEWWPRMIGNQGSGANGKLSLWDVKESMDIFKQNGNGTFYCFRGRSDVFYIPGKFADEFQTLSYIFYKHSSFLEIAVPTMCRILDRAENFEHIPGVYLPGKSGEPPVRKAEHFWEVYDKTIAFIHPFKLNYKHDGALNAALLRSWIKEYSDSLSKCKRNK